MNIGSSLMTWFHSTPTPHQDVNTVAEAPSVSPDHHLIARICQCDEHALELLYARHGALVYAVALRITQNQAVAEEVVQDVFHAAWQSAASFLPSGTVVHWLLGIARHRAIDATRARGFRAAARWASFDDWSLPAAEQFDYLAEQLMVRDALGALPKAQRQVIELAYYGGFSCAMISEQLNEPIGTIKTRMRLAMCKLRDTLEPAV